MFQISITIPLLWSSSEHCETFQVDLIIDTGDLVDYGIVFEAGRFADFCQVKHSLCFYP